MPAKSAVLEALTHNELLALVDRWGLTVEDRRVKEQLVEAAATQASYLPAVLGEFTRERLKDSLQSTSQGDTVPKLPERGQRRSTGWSAVSPVRGAPHSFPWRTTR